jgi:hypothetical protein
MKHELELPSNPPAKFLFKLTVFGCFLLGFAYVSIVLMNTALKALH